MFLTSFLTNIRLVKGLEIWRTLVRIPIRVRSQIPATVRNAPSAVDTFLIWSMGCRWGTNMRNLSYGLLLTSLLPNIRWCLGMELGHQRNNRIHQFDDLLTAVTAVLPLPSIFLIYDEVPLLLLMKLNQHFWGWFDQTSD